MTKNGLLRSRMALKERRQRQSKPIQSAALGTAMAVRNGAYAPVKGQRSLSLQNRYAIRRFHSGPRLFVAMTYEAIDSGCE